MTALDLPDDDTTQYVPAAINNWGQVVVRGSDSSDEATGPQLLLWQNGRVLDLGDLASEVEAWPVFYWPTFFDVAPHSFDINDRGQIVGAGSYDVSSDDSGTRFVMWEVPPLWGYLNGL